MISLINFLGILLFQTIITFGNGPIMLPLLSQSLVQNQHYIANDQLLYAYAIGRVTPGQVNLYISAIGFFVGGFIGAILALITIILPGVIMIPAMHGYQKVKDIGVVGHLTKGITVASIGLILSATASIGKDVLTGVIPWIVFLTCVILTKVIKLNGFLSFAAASVLGIILYYLPLFR
ncbi:MAG TPA: chromate transporter [Patescibacteria group bacterium]|nr:chromate transporter [Patescibacteria group bacterium]